MGQEIPTLMTSSTLFSVTKNKFFTAADLDCSQGFPVESQQSFGRYRDCLPFDLEQYRNLPRHQSVHMSGNGMHLCAVAAWHLYVLSNIVSRQTIDGSPRRSLPCKREAEAVSRSQRPRRQGSFEYERIDVIFKKMSSFQYESETL